VEDNQKKRKKKNRKTKEKERNKSEKEGGRERKRSMGHHKYDEVSDLYMKNNEEMTIVRSQRSFTKQSSMLVRTEGLYVVQIHTNAELF
jgi:hypothetical protein